MKSRVLAKGLSKLIQPIANKQATFLVLNQLKTNIPPRHRSTEVLTTPYKTPGGMALTYSYSLRIWLTDRKGKASFLLDDKGFRVGTELRAQLKKSRFGTQGRQSTFKIIWGDAENVKICDQESWLEAIKSSEHVTVGSYCKLVYADGTETKSFRQSEWVEKLKDKKFYNRVIELMEEEVVLKFDKRLGSAESFYDIGEEGEENGKSKKRKQAKKQ